jgi:hypothetical protein
MSDEMKLLRALCDALGFEVETTLDYAPRRENKTTAMAYNSGRTGMDRCLASSGPHNKLDIDENGDYTSLLKSPIVEYKVVPKEQS